MHPLIIQSIAADDIRQRAERAERIRRVRQARAAARESGGRSRRRAPVAIFRPATLRAAVPAIRFPR